MVGCPTDAGGALPPPLGAPTLITMSRESRPGTYRPHRGLALAMAGAAGFWGFALYYLLTFDGVPWKTLFTAACFVVFFLIGVLYYGRTAIFVDDKGFTYRGMLRTVRVAYEDIRGVHVLPGPLTVYCVRGANRLVHFTSFFMRHRALMELLCERGRVEAAAL